MYPGDNNLFFFPSFFPRLTQGDKNGVTYEVVGGNGTDLFGVDARTGWVLTSQPLLGRRNSVFALVVRAVDDGIPPLYQEVKVSLVVTGQNRFSPVFTGGRPYQVSVEENAALGKPIITVSATDDDGADNPNGVVQYYISSGNDRGKFAINARSGTLTVAEGLDFDSVQKYVINVTASDSGFLQNSAETSVVINIVSVYARVCKNVVLALGSNCHARDDGTLSLSLSLFFFFFPFII